MFEKEAEEYCMHQSLLEDVRDNICKAFEDGAEFGYNKCNTELAKAKAIIKEMLSILPKENIEGIYEITEEAEQFIRVGVEQSISEEYTIQKDILSLWEQTICEIRSDIKLQCSPALVYAKELCDKLERSMCALAGGHYSLRYNIE